MSQVLRGLHVALDPLRTTKPPTTRVSQGPPLPAGRHSLQVPIPSPLRSSVIPMPSRPPTPPQVALPTLPSAPPYLSTMLPPAATLSPSVDSLLAMIQNLAKEVADGKVKQAETAARL